MVRRGGIVLILVSGILTVMALLGAMLVRAAGLSAVIGEARSAGVGAELLAENGLHYAAARLLGEAGYPVLNRIADTRGDDWAYRDSWTRDLAVADNPSYSHGECWTDNAALAANGLDDDGDGQIDETDEVFGAYNPGEWSAAGDTDRNGKFSAWSGRLRGSDGPFSGLFSLKVAPSAALYPLNHGVPEIDGASLVTIPAGLGLKRLGDNLGAILLTAANGVAVPHDAIGRWDVPGAGGAGEPIRSSRLGTHLLENRPPGGYATIQQVDDTLASLGYTQAERNLVLPFLELGTGHFIGDAGRPVDPLVGEDSLPLPQISLFGTPCEILEANWLYASLPTSPLLYATHGLCMNATNPPPPAPPSPTPASVIPRYARAPVRPYLSGGDFDEDGSAPPDPDDAGIDKVMIYPDEARRLALWAVDFRETPQRHSWRALRESLFARARLDSADPLFLVPGAGNDDIDPLVAGGFVDAAWAWSYAKTELAFHAISRDVPAIDALFSARLSGGLPFAAPRPAEYPSFPRPFSGILHGHYLTDVPRPASSSPATAWAAWSNDLAPYNSEAMSAWGYAYQPLPLTLAPPDNFTIESLARTERGVARSRGSLTTFSRLEFASQEDFENLASWTLAGRGAWTWRMHDLRVIEPDPADVEAARRPLVTWAGRAYPGVQTGPNYTSRWLDLSDTQWWGTSDRYMEDIWKGSVGLADLASGPMSAYLYFPFIPDWTSRPGAEGNPETEFTSEGNPFVFPVDPATFAATAEGVSFNCPGMLLPWTPPNSFLLPSPPALLGDFSIEMFDRTTTTGNLLKIEKLVDNNEPAKQITLDRKAAYRAINLGGGPVWTHGIEYTAVFRGEASTHQYKWSLQSQMWQAGGGVSTPPDHVLKAVAFIPDYLVRDQNHIVITVGKDNIWGSDAPVGMDPEFLGMPPAPLLGRPPMNDSNTSPALPSGETEDVKLRPGVGGDGKESLVLRLYVNGLYSAYPDENGVLHDALGADGGPAWRDYAPNYRGNTAPRCFRNQAHRPLRFPSNKSLIVAGDEIRFHDKVLPLSTGNLANPGVKDLYGAGRYVVPGAVAGDTVFRSPVYAFNGGPRKLLDACAAMIPGERNTLGNDRIGIRVKIQPCDGAGAPVGSPILAGEVEELLDLRGMGLLEAFQYEIEFYNKSGSLDPLYETPLFESLWIAVGRTAPRWSSWD